MATNFPPLPQVSGDLLLDVFTHRTLLFQGAPKNEEYGDNERIAQLGTQIIDLATTFALFSKRPLLSAEEIASKRSEHLSDANVESWVVMYRLRDKLRFAPDAIELIKTPSEARLLLASYIGAVYLQSGLAPIQNWIARLIDPEAEPPVVPDQQHQQQYQQQQQQHWGSPPPPSSNPPPLPANGAPVPPNLTTIALFNQMAAQNGLIVTYPAESVGPPHQPRWTVKCVVNGVEKGVGIGRNQKQAREDAAKQAFQAMGWSARC